MNVLAHPNIFSFIGAIGLQYAVNYREDQFMWNMVPFGRDFRFVIESFLFFQVLLRGHVYLAAFFAIIMVLEATQIIENFLGGTE